MFFTRQKTDRIVLTICRLVRHKQFIYPLRNKIQSAYTSNHYRRIAACRITDRYMPYKEKRKHQYIDDYKHSGNILSTPECKCQYRDKHYLSNGSQNKIFGILHRHLSIFRSLYKQPIGYLMGVVDIPLKKTYTLLQLMKSV